MITEVQFRINKYTHFFNWIDTGYGGMTEFIVED
jgi:hypothetical protein